MITTLMIAVLVIGLIALIIAVVKGEARSRKASPAQSAPYERRTTIAGEESNKGNEEDT
jgi:FtsZ-interacting cell division protein ZipA